MRKKTKYRDEPMKLKVVGDFLPPPHQLVPNEENVRVTIELSKSSIDFFKKEAEKHQGHYQQMIRNVLNLYAAKYQGGSAV